MKQLFKIATITLLVSSMSLAFGQGKKIEQVFSYDMIGADLPYLESFIGIAKRTDTHFKTKHYLVDGCELAVGYEGNSITTMAVSTGGKCNFTIDDIPMGSPINTSQVVFGMTGPVDYYADCLYLCGNAYEPMVYEHYQGPHVEEFREILLGSFVPYEATSQWVDAMIAKEGEDWVMDGNYNCDPRKYHDVAEKVLKGQKVDWIMIGYNLLNQKQFNDGCQNQSQAAASTSPSVKDGEMIAEIPYQVAYQNSDYTYYLGSQIISGEVVYEPNDMYGYRFEFKPDQKSQSKLPPMAQGRQFILNEYSEMSENELLGASYYLGIENNLIEPDFADNLCTLKGPATFQIIGIGLYLPEEAEPFTDIKSLKIINGGPYKITQCDAL